MDQNWKKSRLKYTKIVKEMFNDTENRLRDLEKRGADIS